jgi:heat shock protein HslJ
MRGQTLLVVFAFLLGTTAFAGGEEIAASSEKPNLDGTGWVLTALPGSSLLPDQPVTLWLQSGRVHGSDGCNRYSAPYAADSDGFQLTAPVVSTKMACPGPVMRQAEAFLAALTNARGVRASGKQLVLVDTDGKPLATFGVQSQDLAGTSWRVTAYNNGGEAVINVLPGTTVSLQFSSDGEVKGFAGCNDFSGKYALSRGNLALRDSSATRNACTQPEGVMVQESLFFKALALAALARIDADRLELRARDGALVISATRDGSMVSSGGSVLAGELTYMADAARFTDCSRGRSYPVAMESDFKSLERAYLEAVKEPGAPLYVTFEGAIADRLKMEGEGKEPTVVVSRFIDVQPDKRCGN